MRQCCCQPTATGVDDQFAGAGQGEPPHDGVTDDGGAVEPAGAKWHEKLRCPTEWELEWSPHGVISSSSEQDYFPAHKRVALTTIPTDPRDVGRRDGTGGCEVDDPSRHLPPSLRLRTSRPTLPPGFVPRPRIDEQLRPRGRRHVTVVTAGPGYGKTLAVAAHLAGRGDRHTAAWLAVSDVAGLSTFWGDFLGALTAARIPGVESLSEMAPGNDFSLSDVDLIADALARHSRPLTIVLDEVQRITDPTVLESITRFIASQPDQVQLVVISRTTPRLHLRRLQLDGRLTEIGADALTMTRGEVGEFAECAGAGPMSDDDVVGFWLRTEGWPAGIRLALLSAGAAGLRAWLHRGHDELIASYLLEEVLEQIPPTDRKFLLATSVAEALDPALAEAITRRPDCRRILASLADANLFTVRLEGRPDWYAYHPLFRELLAERLTAENPDAPAELHRRAATWFARAGDPISAIRHLAAARDWEALLEVLGGSAVPLVLSPQSAELAAALAPAVDEAARRPTAETLLAGVIVAFHDRDFGVMFHRADAAEAALSRRAGGRSATAEIILALAAMVRARVEAVDHVVSRCDAVFALATAPSNVGLPAAPAYALMARANRAMGLVHRGDVDDAVAELESVHAAAEARGMGLMAVAAQAHLALTDLIVGDLARTAERVATVESIARRRGWLKKPQMMAMYAAQALLLLERHDLTAAESAIDTARLTVGEASDTAALLLVEIAAVGVAVTRRDTFGARAAEGRMRVVAARCGPLPALLRSWCAVVSAEVSILAGDAASIVGISSGATGFPPADAVGAYPEALGRIVRARAFVELGRPADAISQLGQLTEYAPFRLQAVGAGVLWAVAAHQLRRDSVALDHIAAAVSLAAEVGQVRPFAVTGEPARALLAWHVRIAGPRVDLGFVLDLLGILGDDAPQTGDLDVLESVEDPLTERELVVLRYLPTMYKAAEIAADLFVSVNTVKTHQQAIYRKLGVSSRRDAVDRARERNLL